ncbi:MAG: phosphodiesterase [Aeromonadaceae bacterium]
MTTLAILSDIHGSASALERTLECLHAFAPSHYLLLGDLLNHGPRNPVPEGYAPARVAELLNSLKQQIIAVRGNCDSEVDQMLLEFPMLAPYNYLLLQGRRVCLTHGHLYDSKQLALSPGALLLSGHSHVAGITRDEEGVVCMNPGSITFPRQGEASFGLYRDGELLLMSVAGGTCLQRYAWAA